MKVVRGLSVVASGDFDREGARCNETMWPTLVMRDGESVEAFAERVREAILEWATRAP